MVKNQTDKLQKLLKILSHESKFKIIMHLAKGEECVCMIAKELNMEQSLVSHHVNDLREAGLVHDRKIGAWVHCSLDREAFKALETLFLEHFGQENLSNKMCSLHEECRCQLEVN
ncbi:metalloregulator ArsR/SmtB family transcription factor [Patescibacteria group bacterium]|nr:metalloregulator ArsR/SmtB family transcription factor [Patescibacteria group bacterium]